MTNDINILIDAYDWSILGIYLFLGILVALPIAGLGEWIYDHYLIGCHLAAADENAGEAEQIAELADEIAAEVMADDARKVSS